MSTDVGQSIAVNVAIKAAVELAAATSDPFGAFFNGVDDVVKTVLQIHTDNAVEAVSSAFPGTTVVAAPAPQQFTPAPAPQPSFQPAVQQLGPAPIPSAANGDTDIENLWKAFFAAVQAGQVAADFRGAANGQWFDNRAGKSPKAPDFKVKGNKGEQTPGVWVDDKKNPSWVAGQLAAIGVR